MKINIYTDLTQAPKKELIKELTVLFISHEIEKLQSYFSEDISWTFSGEKPVLGKQNFANILNKNSCSKTTELTIHNIITEDRAACIHGEMKMDDGNAFGFSDFYTFSSSEFTSIKTLWSYVVQINLSKTDSK